MINDKLTIKYNGIIFKLNKFLFNCKTKLIIKLVGDMPIIMNRFRAAIPERCSGLGS